MFRQREEDYAGFIKFKKCYIESHPIKNGQNEDGLRNVNLLHNPPHSRKF